MLKAFLDGSFARDVDFEFTIGDDKVFNHLWIHVDGIYPDLSRFVKTLQELVGRRASRYAVWQESARKDIERAFGVLQRKFHVLACWKICAMVCKRNCQCCEVLFVSSQHDAW